MSKEVAIKLHVASVTEHGAAGGHEAKLFQATGNFDPATVSSQPLVRLDINSTEKLIELGYYEMTLRKVE